MAKWLYERAGVQLTLHTRDRSANALVCEALSGLGLRSSNSTRGIRLSVKTLEEGAVWRLQDHSNDLRRKLESAGDLIYHLSDRLIFHIADQAEGKHCLHAAAVAHGDRALVIPANSGAGKSSLTAWLVANQFAYLTDELILIDEHFTLEAVTRPIQIKAAGLSVIEPLMVKDAKFYPGSLANAVPAESLGGQHYLSLNSDPSLSASSNTDPNTNPSANPSANPNPKIGMILFPRYLAGAGYSLTRLSSAEAGMQLMSNHVNARNLKDHGFRAMMQLIRETPCFKLEYGGFDKLPDDFSRVIQEQLAGGDSHK